MGYYFFGMDSSSEWDVVNLNELYIDDEGKKNVISKVWVRQFQNDVEAWSISLVWEEELSYNVLYTQNHVSMSLRDIFSNIKDLNVSFSGGLSISFESKVRLEFDESVVVSSFDGFVGAEEYIEEQVQGV